MRHGCEKLHAMFNIKIQPHANTMHTALPNIQYMNTPFYIIQIYESTYQVVSCSLFMHAHKLQSVLGHCGTSF